MGEVFDETYLEVTTQNKDDKGKERENTIEFPQQNYRHTREKTMHERMDKISGERKKRRIY